MPNKYLDFKVDLCELRLGDMILESDAPYLHPKDYQEVSNTVGCCIQTKQWLNP
jgi:Tat protein secretion system quality control protein TatD with DNase activity